MGLINRRGFLVGAAALALTPALAQAATAKAAFIVPDGQGDGSSFESPASLQSLGELVKRVGAGGIVYLIAGKEYKAGKPIMIAASGSKGAPVTITGVDKGLRPKRAVIKGSRKGWRKGGATDAGGFGGNTLFAFSGNASNLTFTNLSVQHTGRVFDFSGNKGSGITVQDVDFYNVRDGFYTDGGSSVKNVVLRRFNGVGFSKKAVRFHGSSKGWLIEDCEFDSGLQFGDNFAVGIEANDRASGLQINGGYTINCLDKAGGNQKKYWNADGVAAERGNSNIRISNHRSAGNSDGGYDLKSEDTILSGCVSEDNKRNFRIWGGSKSRPVLIENCRSGNPKSRGGIGGAHHLWISGKGDGGPRPGYVRVQGGSFSGGAPNGMIYADGANAVVQLVGTKISGGDKKLLFVADDDSSKLIQS
jgi:serralysin